MEGGKGHKAAAVADVKESSFVKRDGGRWNLLVSHLFLLYVAISRQFLRADFFLLTLSIKEREREWQRMREGCTKSGI